MNRPISRISCTAALLAAVGFVLAAAPAQAIGPGKPVVADNYYVPPGTPAGVGAQMYPAPRYVPPLVGYTYITYPPFDPHEYLWHHYEQHGNGHTQTRVHYGGWDVARNVHWLVHGLPNRSTFFQ